MHHLNSKVLHRFAATAVALLALKPLHAAAPAMAAAAYQPPASIVKAAELAVHAAAGSGTTNLIATADAPDPRLQLAACAAPLRTGIAGDGQLREHTTVAVRCESSTPWTLYIGVTLSTAAPVLVAQHALARDAVPTAADFTTVVRHLPGLSSRYVSDPAQLAGQRLRRPVAMGEALDVDALSTAVVVHRGQQLTLLAHTAGMDVRVTVIALMDGRPDERIRVQNPASQRVVEATVRSAQYAEVTL
ncbi:MAG: flagellar basal body P-ring formation protein FlgA [Proteobacteria bacterium]|nr:flagellar basal body P-ring formation protein FlgA [Pseudomonadota bacterium]